MSMIRVENLTFSYPSSYDTIFDNVMQIEHLIKQFAPTMLLVEHDIAFREAIATKVVKL